MYKRLLAVAVIALVLFLVSVPIFATVAQTSGGACPGAPLPRLRAGDVARPAQVFSTLWQSPTDTGILAVLYRSSGDTFTVVSGSACSNGPYNWYQVNFRGISGWVTEGTGDTYWVEKVSAGTTPTPPTPTATPIPRTPVPTIIPTTPTIVPGGCPGAPAPRLTINGNARPAQVFSSLRAGLDSNAILKVMYRANGDTFKVLEGPFCGTQPHNWWKVDYKGTVGWVTEGVGSTYWVEPVT